MNLEQMGSAGFLRLSHSTRCVDAKAQTVIR
jgi:hypothetical protein